ncbi:MAG: chromosomal replication initiator DnaA [Paracoccaceae bacterium]
MKEQLVFDLPCRTALGRDDYFVSPANEDVLSVIDGWKSWPEGRLALTGPAGSGKTHLACVWAEAASARLVEAVELGAGDVPELAAGGAVAVENADRMSGLAPGARADAERAFLHLHNLLLSGGGALLVTGRDAPARWKIDLPDLASRLRAAQVATLPPPDDRLLGAVLVKLFDDRQLTVAPDLVRYLVTRMERSLAAAAGLVEALDRASMQRKRPVTRALASDILTREPR